MLSQDKVNDLACRFLTEAGWAVRSKREARRPGVDTVAERNGHRLVVAPRGEGSSLRGTSRYGKTFTRSQVYAHVGESIARLLRVVADGRTIAALAVPDDAHHREAIGGMLGPIASVGIGVLWVSADGEVTADTPWSV